jgi:hypothetical protein
MAIATAFLVAASAYVCAWISYRNFMSVRDLRCWTIRDLKLLRDGIEQYRQTTGRLPAKLSDLAVVQEKRLYLATEGEPRDMWNTPFVYRNSGDDYVLLSLGPDREPGGVGYDADLTADDEPPKATLWEFTTDPYTTGMKLCCIGAGLLALPICLQIAKSRPALSLTRVLVELAVTAIFAFATGVLISVLHLPTGH